MKRIILAVIAASLTALSAGPGLAEDPVDLQGAEQQAMADTLQYALENNPTDQSSAWVNPDTGRSGTTVPVRTYQDSIGRQCREFITTIIIGGREEQGYGTACRQPDGSWELAPDAEAVGQASQPPPRIETYSYQTPAQYYAYPSGFYGGSRIYLSFNHVVRGSRLHYGSFYLDGRTFHTRHRHPVRERVYIGPRFIERYRIRDEWRYRDWERRHDWNDDRFKYKYKSKQRRYDRRDDRRDDRWDDRRDDRRGRGRD